MEIEEAVVVERVTKAVACPMLDGELLIMPPTTAMALATHICEAVLGEKHYVDPSDEYPLGRWENNNAE